LAPAGDLQHLGAGLRPEVPPAAQQSLHREPVDLHCGDTPKLAPAPRNAHNRSGSESAVTCRSTPSAVIASITAHGRRRPVVPSQQSDPNAEGVPTAPTSGLDPFSGASPFGWSRGSHPASGHPLPSARSARGGSTPAAPPMRPVVIITAPSAGTVGAVPGIRGRDRTAFTCGRPDRRDRVRGLGRLDDHHRMVVDAKGAPDHPRSSPPSHARYIGPEPALPSPMSPAVCTVAHPVLEASDAAAATAWPPWWPSGRR
jgi:hypothetical protein